MDSALVRLVWRRARARCEYCNLAQVHDDAVFEVDHIIARNLGGPTVAGNLALSCFPCNAAKGSNIAGRDVVTGKLTSFNPRRHKWAWHFRWAGARLLGRTAIGRVTVTVLNINDQFRVAMRDGLIAEGLFPTA